jgi:hypothetical protein
VNRTQGDAPSASEWDFSRMAEAELSSAMLYEYARESSLVRGHIQDWQEGITHLRAFQTSGTAQFLNHAIDPLLDSFPLVRFRGWFIAFPEPWLEIHSSYKLEREEESFEEYSIRKPVTDLTNLWDEYRKNLAPSPMFNSGSRVYLMEIDWRAKDTPIIEAFKTEFLSKRPKEVQAVETRGKSNARSALRQLSALRLSRFGYGYRRAQRLVPQGVSEILPDYTEKGWRDALAGATENVRKIESFFRLKTEP